MLEEYFAKPATVDRLRGSWMGAEIETYVDWLAAHQYKDRYIWSRVPVVFAFGEFAGARGAATIVELPAHVDAFVEHRVALHHEHTRSTRPMTNEVRGPVEHMLAVVLDGYAPTGRKRGLHPFADTAPGFFDYLVQERGLRPFTVRRYRIHLDHFETYLRKIGVESIREISPTILSAFLVERAGAGLAKTTVRDEAGSLKVFLRYAHRQGVLSRDLSSAVGWPQAYRLSEIPRSISWADVNQVLASVDRRTETGRRDYAILLLLVT
ncbi:tyrosine-type recombinase/integrase [Arthrobacter sp. NA-172]|uniref:tyrosine-type recombinase/integrase n=1 Tax=Arthrobacter sp. NA-172 TaxID=3367524 RepID=UPI0037540BFD